MKTKCRVQRCANSFTKGCAILMVALLLPGVANAGTWTGTKNIETVYVSSSFNGIYIKLDTMEDPGGCGLIDFYVIESSLNNFDELYAALLSSRMAGLPANFYLSGCATGRPKISHGIF